ncbi:hypothetical protein FOZ62_028539 [Perkinsus olseni]|uniref:Immunoglobulin super DCC subclass member n=1 Tax=Perkinsus olseni TaxID=32597 RepID=A0A7J6TJ25_PEROL|nr:hypothetical protein FOZ62_028539 [Perkinsus olseni]
MRFLVNALVVTLVAADSACTAADRTVMANDHFPGVLWQCSEDALLTPKKVIPPCLKKDCGLSEGCAECFGDFDCAKCMDDHNCNKALLECTGLDKLFPPPTEKYSKC